MRLPTLILALAATAACSAQQTDTQTTQTAQASQARGIELYTMDCGTIEISDIGVFSTAGDYDGQSDTFGNGCFLIRHPEGNLLWDLGLPAALVESGPQVNGIYTASLEQTLTDQLKELAMNPQDIDFVAISHHHFDHVGQAEQFTDARFLIHENEYEAMFGGETIDPAHMAFINVETETFTGDHDVFGDQSVIILSTPGHTPGHTSLLIDLAGRGPVLLTGDLYHRSESRALKRIPEMNSDAAATIESMALFETLATTLGAEVIIQHSQADLANLPAFPEPAR